MLKIQLKKEEKAITLIALVITIIVLLILAGVAISSLSGENGILKRTTDAKIQTQLARSRRRSKNNIYGLCSKQIPNWSK